MRRPPAALLLCCLLLPSGLRAQSDENIQASSARSFASSTSSALPQAGAANAPDPGWLVLVKLATAQYFHSHTFQLQPQGSLNAPSAPIAGLDLAPLRNRQWDSPATLNLGGTTVRLSGQFSRAAKAFFAVQVADEKTPRFLSLDDLLEGTPRLAFASATYQVILVPEVLDRLGSRVAFRNLADVNDGHGLTMRHILDLVYSAGSPVQAGGRELRVFYGQDVDDSVTPARACSCESVAILTHAGDEYFTFLIPLESIPTQGPPAVFNLRGAPIALRRNAGALEFFQP